MHVLNLARIHVRAAHLHGGRQVDDGLAVGRGLPHVQHGVAYLKGILGLGAGEALGAVLETIVVVTRFVGELFQQLRAVDGDLLDLLAVALEHLLALGDARGVVHMHHHRGLAALERGERLADDVVARLGEHLNGDVLGNHVVLDQRACEFEFGLAGSGEANLDLLEADGYELLPKLQLLFQAHGDDQGLVAVAQVNAAPFGRMLDIVLLHPVVARFGRHVEAGLVFGMGGHSCHERYLLVRPGIAGRLLAMQEASS